MCAAHLPVCGYVLWDCGLGKAELGVVVLGVSALPSEWCRWGCAWVCVVLETDCFSFLSPVRFVRESIRF